MDALPSPRHPLALALLGITSVEIGAEPRSQVRWAADAGYRALQLNAAAPGVRPRDLDRSARRDVAALLRRHGLTSSGVDLFIPPDHLADPTHADRAIGAIIGAIELAADLAELTAGDPIFSTALPRDPNADDAIHAIAEAAQARSVRVADHAWPPTDRPAGSPIGVGIDPAAVFLGANDAGDAPADPARAVPFLRDRLAGVRLSDLDASGRVPPGDGRLDELAYLVAITTSCFPGRLVVDLRGLRRPADAARDALRRFDTGTANAP